MEEGREFLSISRFFFKWLLISLIIGFLAGTASALFLISLNAVTNFRESNLWIIGLLPIGGLLVGLTYHYLGEGTESGNNLVIDTIHNPGKTIPLKLAPLVFCGTILTHLFGGSAGREGTAVQIGASIADQFSELFKLTIADRKLIIIAGISAGFSSVFGTPLAGAIFGLEVFIVGRITHSAILPALLSGLIANYVTSNIWGVSHSHYQITDVPDLSIITFIPALISGICFGLAAKLFIFLSHYFNLLFQKNIRFSPFRPFFGGFILVSLFTAIYYFSGTTKYTGLGLPVIAAAFTSPSPYYDFALKIFLTALTLGCGFKGGEVTPLFFIGATLGSALSVFLPIPISLLAGIGFVAVFAGASNTPLACIMMAMELFGAPCGVYAGIACVTAYLFSGHTGIYSSQLIGSAKNTFYANEEGKSLSVIQEIRKKLRK